MNNQKMNIRNHLQENLSNSMPPPTYHPSFRQIEHGPLGSSPSPFEPSLRREYHQSSHHLHHGAHSLGRTYHYYPWEAPQIDYIADIQPNDVLSGRGGATNSHSGNRAFRSLVQQYKNDYLKAKKRDKPQVAALIVEKVREKGGRFLRRCPTKFEGVVWIEIGDARAKEKTCQALREGAPEIRRRKAVSENDETRRSRDSDGSLSATSTFDRTVSETDEENKIPHPGRTQILRTDFETEKMEAVSSIGGPMVIRPSMMLICTKSSDRQLSIPVDHLDRLERDMYLRDFLPPNPSIQTKRVGVRAKATSAAEGAQSNESRLDIDTDRDGWDTHVLV